MPARYHQQQLFFLVAAWLIDNRKKIVIAPQRWFAEEQFEAQTENLVPKGWIRYKI